MPRSTTPTSSKKTYKDRLAFGDRDLETGLHDEIMLWLDKNLAGVIGTLFDDWNVDRVRKLQADTEIAAREYLESGQVEFGEFSSRSSTDRLRAWNGLGDPPEKPEHMVTIQEKQWESPIIDKAKPGTPFGFADMRVLCSVKRLMVPGFGYRHGHPVLDFRGSFSKDGMLLAVGDEGPSWECLDSTYTCYFEVKSAIRLGELIRQIRYYQEALRPRPDDALPWFIVVAPADTHAAVLREQGIDFVRYTPEAPVQATLFGKAG